MKKILIIAASVLILVIGALVVAFLVLGRAPATAGPGASANPFGTGGLQSQQASTTPTATTVIRTRGGDTLSIPDITTGHPAITEQSGTYYYVTQNANGDEMNQDFGILYGTDSSIAVGLLAEPLGASRLHAETALRKLLQLPDSQICALNVTVMVPPSVSDVYAGTNVGLSFCPNAVTLP